MLTHGGTHDIELLEYSIRPIVIRQTDLRPSDRAGRHLAFYVEDIETVTEQLKQRDDIRLLGALQKEVVGGSIDGTDWVYNDVVGIGP